MLNPNFAFRNFNYEYLMLLLYLCERVISSEAAETEGIEQK